MFPEPANSASPTNIKIVDFVTLAKMREFRILDARRLISVAITADGRRLLVAELRNPGRLLVYDPRARSSLRPRPKT